MLNFANWLATIVVFASLASAQEIRGVVTEPGTNHGLADAQITIRKVGPRVIGKPITSEEVAKLKTDAQGMFAFKAEFGEYTMRAEKEGFTPVSGNILRGFLSSQANFVLDKENPMREFQFSLGRRGTITGRIVDADTDKPMVGFKLGVSSYGVTNGSTRTLPNGGDLTTDAQGAFRADVIPNRYVIETRPQVRFGERLVKSFTSEDIAKTDMDYRRRYFPGGAELAVSLPLTVPSGGSVDFGTIRIRKEPFFRIHVKTGGQCQPGQMIHVMDTMAYEGSRWSNDIGDVPCGNDFLLRNVEPGHYTMEARIGKTPDDLIRANSMFDIRESNLELAMTLERGPDLVGRVFAADNAGSVPMDKLQFVFRPIDVVAFAVDARPLTADSKGQFRLENTTRGRKQLSVAGLGNQYYVKQVRYNGSPIPGQIVDFSGTGPVEIEIDSQPTAITGSVRFRDRAVSGADVVLVRWPLLSADDSTAVRHITANDKGDFQAAGLAPGEYRIFAVRSEDRDSSEAPSAWQGLISRGQKLELTRGAAPSITLTPVDFSR